MPSPRRAQARRRLSFLTLAALGSVSAANAPAQPASPTTVRGAVRLADGSAVFGATVWIVGQSGADTSIAATTDVRGEYQFTLPVRDSGVLVVRRRGFDDARIVAPVASVSRGRRTMNLPATTLAATVTPAASAVVQDVGDYVGRDAIFYRHMRLRRGEFLTRTEIARMASSRTSALLRGMRGVNLVTTGGGTYVRLRSMSCYATVFIDGTAAGPRAFDVDLLAPSSLAGIEVFPEVSALPVEYHSGDATSCGAIGFWTLRGDEARGGDFEVASVVEPATVRLPGEIDSPVRLVDSAAFAPRYPASARAAGRGGSVVIELVVDSVGRVERSSLGVVALSDPELAMATLRGLDRVQFVPATHRGQGVRQLVHLVARFEVAGGKVEKR